MKRLLIPLFSILIGAILILVATKPSKERCKEEFKRSLITLTSSDFVIYSDKDIHYDNPQLKKSMDRAIEEASEKFSIEHWENYYAYKDYLLFCIVKFDGLALHKKIGWGILNSTFEL